MFVGVAVNKKSKGEKKSSRNIDVEISMKIPINSNKELF